MRGASPLLALTVLGLLPVLPPRGFIPALLRLAAWVLPAPLREAAADERFALEVLRLEAAELRLAEEDPAALLREELADERLAEEDPATLLREELAALLREEEAADERLELEELRLVVPSPFLVTVAFLSC